MSNDVNLDLVRARAKVLAAEHRAMKKALVEMRRDSGMTQQDVADFMGCTQQAVQKFERYSADPQLSTIRRYANAVGALITHSVSKADSAPTTFTPYVVFGANEKAMFRATFSFPDSNVDLLEVTRERTNTHWGSAQLIVNEEVMEVA